MFPGCKIKFLPLLSKKISWFLSSISVTKVYSAQSALSSLPEEFQLFIRTCCYPYLYSSQNLNNTLAEHWEYSYTGVYGRFVLIYFYTKRKRRRSWEGNICFGLSLRCRVMAWTYEQILCVPSEVFAMCFCINFILGKGTSRLFPQPMYHPCSMQQLPVLLTNTDQAQLEAGHPIGLRNDQIKVTSKMWLVQRWSIPLEVCWSLSAHHIYSNHVTFGVKACAAPWAGSKGKRIGSQRNPVALRPLPNCWQALFATAQAEQIPSKPCCEDTASHGCKHTAELGLQVWLMNCLVDSHCQIVVLTGLNYL